MVEDKAHPRTCQEGTEGEKRYSPSLSLLYALDGGGWLTPRPGCFTSGNSPVPIVQEGGWALVPFWTGCGKPCPHRDLISGAYYIYGYSYMYYYTYDYLCI
jgi:hypothetical protein